MEEVVSVPALVLVEEEGEVAEVVAEEEEDSLPVGTAPEIPPVSPPGGVWGVPVKASAAA